MSESESLKLGKNEADSLARAEFQRFLSLKVSFLMSSSPTGFMLVVSSQGFQTYSRDKVTLRRLKRSDAQNSLEGIFP